MIGSLEVMHEIIFTIPSVFQISISSIRLRFNLRKPRLSCVIQNSLKRSQFFVVNGTVNDKMVHNIVNDSFVYTSDSSLVKLSAMHTL